MDFPPHDICAPFDFAREEEKVLAYWRQIDAFKTSLKLSEGKPRFSFYDGPPFATGLPHYGHILAGTIKDIVTRHAHATGFHVERRFGWDTHGLPVEHEIDQKLGITSKDDVARMGITAYNAECRAIVMRYASKWRATIERVGRWIDLDNDYKTLNTPFMESVWWVFSQLYDKGLVYRGLRVMPYSTGCTTTLSNFEAKLNEVEESDPAITVAFPLVDDPTTSLLAWTTTPWTLPSNLAICVHPDFTYIKIHDMNRGMNFILHEDLLATLYKDPKTAKFEKIGQFRGEEMKGWRYVPLFGYFTAQCSDRAFRVLVDKFVTNSDGTGIVHIAPAHGEDDHRVSIAHNVIELDEIPPYLVDDNGRFTKESADFHGQYFKAADKAIVKAVKAKGRLIVESTVVHSNPYCWRSNTLLINRAIPSWFVSVQPYVDSLLSNNEQTRWVPPEVGKRRFSNWLANARDWNISRNRYWGTPIPLWVSQDMEEIICIGSVAELEKLSCETGITDLHRDKIDHITIPSKLGKGELRRIDEVFDCWFESGSMPYAQHHYPFENKAKFETTFPANFISEGIDQTRGWFYTLLVLSTHLFQTAPWKNLVVIGLVLAENGKKMSKKDKNYPDPMGVINKYGADALRIFLVNSPIVRGENLRFREDGVRDVVSRVLLPWLNSFRFFLGQVAVFRKATGTEFRYDSHAPLSGNVMDRWILARCQSLIKHVREEMEAYRLYTTIPRLLDLVDELTNWYIRFNRRRLKGLEGEAETLDALNTLFEALFTLCRTMSSYTPFLTESLYQGLRPFIPASPEQDTRSIHFLSFPQVKTEYFNEVIERQVKRMQAIIELSRTIRDRHALSLKIPLRELVVFHSDHAYLTDVEPLQSYLRSELNVRDITFTSDETRAGVRYRAVADWTVLGRKLRKDVMRVKNALPSVSSDAVKEYMRTGTLNVDGINLVEGDLTIQRYCEGTAKDGLRQFATHTDNDVVILLDVEVHSELQGEWLAREIINRVQKLRKKAGLKATDDIDVFYSFEEGTGTDIVDAIRQHEEIIKRTTGNVPVDAKKRMGRKDVLTEEEQEVADTKFMLSLASP